MLVPQALYDNLAQAISAQLAKISVGNPRNDAVRMGSLVSREQYDSVQQGLGRFLEHTTVLHYGRCTALLDADPDLAASPPPSPLGNPAHHAHPPVQ